MDKSQLTIHLQESVFCRLGISQTSGVGVIAVRDIPQGVDPFIGCFRGDYHPYTDEELNEFAPGIQRMIRDYCVNIDGAWYIPESGLNTLDISFFINHSDTPNVQTSDGETFVTLKHIQAGDELFVDYNTYSEGL